MSISYQLEPISCTRTALSTHQCSVSVWKADK